MIEPTASSLQERVAGPFSMLWRGAARLVRSAVKRGPSRRLDSAVGKALNTIPHGLCIYDADHRLVYVNEGFSRIYAQPRASLPRGIAFLDVLRGSVAVGNYPGRTAEEIWAERKQFIDRQERGVFLQSLGDGRLIAITHEPLDGGGWAAVYEDVTERRRAESHLRFMAHHDPLTGLANRLMFGERLNTVLGALAGGESCAVVVFDLDGFKPVNDHHGHAAGDEVLRQLAARVRTIVRDGDCAARIGGDEFAMLLLGADREVAAGFIERLRRKLRRPYILPSGLKVGVGVSVGAACAPADGGSPDDLIAFADAALYRAKRAYGRRAA